MQFSRAEERVKIHLDTIVLSIVLTLTVDRYLEYYKKKNP